MSDKESTIYFALKNDDFETVLKLVVNENRENDPLHLNSPDIPQLLKFDPYPIHVAAYFGSIESFKILEMNHCNMNSQDRVKRSLIHFSCFGHNQDLLNAVINVSQHLDIVDKIGRNAIHYAAFAGNNDALNLFYMSGVPFDKTDKKGFTPLMLACKTNCFENVESLVNFGADIHVTFNGCSLLIFACEGGNPQTVNLLLEHGFDVNENSPYGTPLSIAVMNNKTEVSKLLLSKGADAKYLIENQNSLCEVAAKFNNIELLEALKSHGALFSPNHDIYKFAESTMNSDTLKYLLKNGFSEKENKNFASVCFLIYKNDIQSIKEVLDLGADINLPDETNQTPLQIAINMKRNDLLLSLIDNGANVNLKNKVGISPIIFAAQKGFIEGVQLLLSKNANVNDCDNLRMTPLHYAVKGGYIDLVHYLLQEGADPKISDINKQTLLMSSIFLENYEIASLLLEKGVDPNEVDKNGYSAMFYAKKKSQYIINLLKSYGAVIKC
ncbi:hypothetical protein TVAG_366230 [Trichomonas vaginalis G3]|uniref:Uncharacterized protein n=1 Tax=Trichomonas vaginalis (strain ATCC PRA-98 / G3) TaxID=412133 RepID=A2DHR7_TRIV3|nr:spectrin binding [Trichomonas vaginalis G3]EAY20115.1 hypothetical protein TVAG_366230 [Trichomonas vaginalis G3]KAI5528068.1 spectrin binding [Trichomonas vaginalis G3]|eukprot:XP_001581101.1 hypothetical protein [Trichomonas vaginalis G3]